MALCVGNAGLRPAPVGQRVGDVPHVPVLILGGLQQLRQKKIYKKINKIKIKITYIDASVNYCTQKCISDTLRWGLMG